MGVFLLKNSKGFEKDYRGSLEEKIKNIGYDKLTDEEKEEVVISEEKYRKLCTLNKVINSAKNEENIIFCEDRKNFIKNRGW